MGLFRKSGGEPLPVAMAAVKLGQRLLAVGATDSALIAQLATRAGLTGRACVVDPDAERLAAGASAIEREGALIEATHAPFGSWPYESESFDVVVMPRILPLLDEQARSRCAADVMRVLRGGGRAIVIDPAPRTGLGALLGRGPAIDPSYRGASAVLQGAGFTAVRELAEADGFVFVEGIKRACSASLA
jgi:ubiquinone/menaquinone biosynthesis C-methylase UbiE